jgi:hypothetical protein
VWTAASGRHAAALATLDRLFQVPGSYNEVWIQRDPGFAALRSYPEFGASMDRWSRQMGDVLLAHAEPPPSK